MLCMCRSFIHFILLGIFSLACARKTNLTGDSAVSNPQVLFIILHLELKDTVFFATVEDQMINPGVLKEDLSSRPQALNPTDLKVSILDDKDQVVITGWVTNPLMRPLEIYQEDGKITSIPRPVSRETFFIRTQYRPGMKKVNIQYVHQHQMMDLLNFNLNTRRQ